MDISDKLNIRIRILVRKTTNSESLARTLFLIRRSLSSDSSLREYATAIDRSMPVEEETGHYKSCHIACGHSRNTSLKLTETPLDAKRHQCTEPHNSSRYAKWFKQQITDR